MHHVLVMCCAIFAAAGSQQAKICLRARSEAVIYVCENEVGRKNAKESQAAVTAVTSQWFRAKPNARDAFSKADAI